MSSHRPAISVILPAYNEAARLPPYLTAVRRYLDECYGGDYEVLVVDDGSADGLAEVLGGQETDWPQLRCLRHERNQGKGAAVRTGMLAAAGRRLLFADADGATPIEEERRLAAALEAGADVAVGSRLAPSAEQQRRRSPLRGLCGRLFAAVARWLLRLSVRDPQCGFKMFQAEPGRRLFAEVQEPRYLFDLELLALVRRLGYRCTEVPVSWREVPGGHLHLLRDLPAVLLGLWRLWRRAVNLPQFTRLS